MKIFPSFAFFCGYTGIEKKGKNWKNCGHSGENGMPIETIKR